MTHEPGPLVRPFGNRLFRLALALTLGVCANGCLTSSLYRSPNPVDNLVPRVLGYGRDRDNALVVNYEPEYPGSGLTYSWSCRLQIPERNLAKLVATALRGDGKRSDGTVVLPWGSIRSLVRPRTSAFDDPLAPIDGAGVNGRRVTFPFRGEDEGTRLVEVPLPLVAPGRSPLNIALLCLATPFTLAVDIVLSPFELVVWAAGSAAGTAIGKSFS